MPKGGIFAMGLLSMMFAAGGPLASILFCGRTFSALGATPKLHCIIAPEMTSCGIGRTPVSSFEDALRRHHDWGLTRRTSPAEVQRLRRWISIHVRAAD